MGKLVDDWLKAPTSARPPLTKKLVALGETALSLTEARLAGNAAPAGLKKLHEQLCGALVLDTFRRVEKLDPEGTLTFAGQFDSLKKHGKRAVIGALAVLKDDDAKMQYRTWAGDALGDLQDPGVVADLKELANDFLREDEIQESAAYAMAALGDRSMLEKKIMMFREDFERGSIPAVLRVAHMNYRGRQYDKALQLYDVVIQQFETIRTERGQEMDAKSREGLENDLAGILYSKACNQSLLGKVDDAFKTLDRSIPYDHRQRFFKGILRDGDLRAVRADKRFTDWYAGWKKRVEAPGKKSDAPAEPAPPVRPPETPKQAEKVEKTDALQTPIPR